MFFIHFISALIFYITYNLENTTCRNFMTIQGKYYKCVKLHISHECLKHQFSSSGAITSIKLCINRGLNNNNNNNNIHIEKTNLV